jgi:outer membrane protein assembly factor BamB
MKRALLLLLLLASVSFPSLLWQYGTDGPVYQKPVIFQNAVVVLSDDGNVYGLDPFAGTRKWETNVGKVPIDIQMSDNSLFVATTTGHVVRLGPNGVAQWDFDLHGAPVNASRIYGISVNSKYVFVTANNGVFTLNKDGTFNSNLTTFNDTVLTAPAAGPDFVVYGKGKELYRLSETGQVMWKATLKEGTFWLSRPVLDGTVVYIGSLDDQMHAYIASNGLEIWQARSRNWILSTPIVKDGTVYFGSDDGGVYAVDGGSGNTRWRAQAPLAVETQPEYGFMGGQEVVFVGGTDKNIYAISKESGEIVWKGSATGSVGSPLFYQNSVIFGSGDGRVYAYSTERACSITYPVEADVVGLKELVVSGKYVSEAGGGRVLVQINGGNWEDANTSEVDWFYIIDPKARLSPGLDTISCQVTDNTGSETGEVFTTVTINHDPTIPLSDLVVTVSPDILESKPFTVYVNDGDDGSPVDRFDLSIAGQNYHADKNQTVVIDSPGTYQATVKKIGFKDAVINVNVNASGVNPIYAAAGVLLILIIVWQLWTRFLSQRFAKKR